jgi:NADH-quinone oxidoreductase subunit L
LIGTPFLSGFYSKDSIIEVVKFSELAGSGFAYFAVTLGVFVTAFYSFRMYFLVFHGKERFRNAHHGHEQEAHADDAHGHDAHDHTPHETPWVVTLPLILLAIPSLLIGYFTVEALLFGNWFGHAVHIAGAWRDARELESHFHGAAAMAIHGMTLLPFWLAVAGVATAWFFYMKRPDIPAAIQKRFSVIHAFWKTNTASIPSTTGSLPAAPVCSVASSGAGATWRPSMACWSTARRVWSAVSPASCGICNPATSITMLSR